MIRSDQMEVEGVRGPRPEPALESHPLTARWELGRWMDRELLCRGSGTMSVTSRAAVFSASAPL